MHCSISKPNCNCIRTSKVIDAIDHPDFIYYLTSQEYMLIEYATSKRAKHAPSEFLDF